MVNAVSSFCITHLVNNYLLLIVRLPRLLLDLMSTEVLLQQGGTRARRYLVCTGST